MKANYTAKGDVITATGVSTISVLPVGSNTNVIKADSAVARGIKWAAVNASEVVNTPAGTIAATTVQAAIDELDTEKAPKASPVFTGTVNLGGLTDYINIAASDGNITWGGTFKKKLTMRPTLITAALVRSGSATTIVPTPVTIGAHVGYSMPIWDAGANVWEELFFREYVAGSWDGATDITISIICALASAETAGEDFRFEVAYQSIKLDGSEVLSAGVTTVEAEYNCAAAAQYQTFKLDFSIPYADVQASDHIGFRVRRIAVEVGGADEVEGEIIVLDCIITYTVDKVYKTA
jgi:hypothetical protein